MNFGEVIAYLKKNPRKVFTRAGWGKEYIYLVEPDCPTQLPYITMFTADKRLIPWVPSQTDILAEDWEVWGRTDPDSLTYLLASPGTAIVTTKDAIEEYVRQRICDYLDVLTRNDCFQRQYDGSGFDSAVRDIREFIDEAIKELRESGENVSDEEDGE